MRPSSRWRQSPKVLQSQASPASRAARGIPSTRAIIRMRYSACSSPEGASVNPQFPPMAVVTPCSGDGLAEGSQESWAS